MRFHTGKLLILSVLMGASSLTACTIQAPAPDSAESDQTAPARNKNDSDKGSSDTAPSIAKPADTTAAPDAPATKKGEKDIVDTAVAAGKFKTLVSAVQAAGLESTLRSSGPFTVFAPTDDAFGKLPAFLLPKLTSSPYKTELGLILKYHVLSSQVQASALLGKTQAIPSVEGGHLNFDGTDAKVQINALSDVITADVRASNGIIHAVDNVLLPSIVDTASGYSDGNTKFTTLVAAIKAADLVATLSGPGTFTVFAPTDQAFANLREEIGEAAFNAILADKAALTKILTYHVLPAIAFQNDVKAGHAVTVQGQNLRLVVDGDNVSVGDSTTKLANVVLTDLPNRNGVIHVIDKVLLPH